MSAKGGKEDVATQIDPICCFASDRLIVLPRRFIGQDFHGFRARFWINVHENDHE